MTVVGWRRLAVVLLVVLALELIWVYAHWGLIASAWKNRKVISDAGDVASGLAALPSVYTDIKNIFQGRS